MSSLQTPCTAWVAFVAMHASAYNAKSLRNVLTSTSQFQGTQASGPAFLGVACVLHSC